MEEREKFETAVIEYLRKMYKAKVVAQGPSEYRHIHRIGYSAIKGWVQFANRQKEYFTGIVNNGELVFIGTSPCKYEANRMVNEWIGGFWERAFEEKRKKVIA